MSSSDGPWDIVIPPLGSNPVNDEDYIAQQTTKNLQSLRDRLSRSITELESYRKLVTNELTERQYGQDDDEARE